MQLAWQRWRCRGRVLLRVMGPAPFSIRHIRLSIGVLYQQRPGHSHDTDMTTWLELDSRLQRFFP